MKVAPEAATAASDDAAAKVDAVTSVQSRETAMDATPRRRSVSSVGFEKSVAHKAVER